MQLGPRNYVSKMNTQTSVKSLWNRIRKIKRKESSNTIHHLSLSDRGVTFHRDIAHALADNVSHNSSSAFSTDVFTSVGTKAQKQNLNVSSENVEVYDRSFSMEDLQDALRRAHDTARPNETHYQLLKYLPKSALSLLLNIFNKICISGDFPSDWRKTIIIPISKPDKDPSNSINYRPIALRSSICKTMEQIITVGLSGISNPTNCSLICNADSNPYAARLIILLDLKRFGGTLSSIISTQFRKVFFNLQKSWK